MFHRRRSAGSSMSRLLLVDVLDAPVHENRHAFGEQPALAGEVAIKDGGRYPQLAHDGRHVGVLVALGGELLRSEGEYPIMHPLTLLRHEIDRDLVGLVDAGL